MKLNELPTITKRSKKRLGRGHGSGRVKTSGRGTKGQKARGKIPAYFEGGGLSLIKRLPMLRGRARNKVLRKKPIVLNVKYLNVLPKGSSVDLQALIVHKLVDVHEAKSYGVKILGEGELSVALSVSLPCSRGARVKIEKAGGKVL